MGFVLIMFGFLLQWPTILTLAMFPILVVMYGYLARREAGVAQVVTTNTIAHETNAIDVSVLVARAVAGVQAP